MICARNGQLLAPERPETSHEALKDLLPDVRPTAASGMEFVKTPWAAIGSRVYHRMSPAESRKRCSVAIWKAACAAAVYESVPWDAETGSGRFREHAAAQPRPARQSHGYIKVATDRH